MVEGEPRPTMVNEPKLPKKPLKRLLGGAVNRVTDLFLITILSGAIMDDGKGNEAISPMSKSKKTQVVK